MARFSVRHLGWDFTSVSDSGAFSHTLPVRENVYLDSRPVTVPVSKPLTADTILSALEKSYGKPASCNVSANRNFLEEVMELIYD